MTDLQKQGWVRFHRKSTDSSVWKNPTIWFVWSWCLLKANHKKNTFPFNGEDVIVNEGSFISGIFKAKEELPTLSVQNIRTAFTYLKSTSRITIKSNNKFSLFTVIKWKEYQIDNKQTNKPLTNEQQATNKPLTTNKNDKNEKKTIISKADVYSFSSSLNKMLKDKQLHIQIIGIYWKWLDWKFENKIQYQSALKRDLRTASSLKGYSLDRIRRTFKYLDEQSNNGKKFNWNLNTVHKYIDGIK